MNRLRYFCVLTQTGSLVRASELLAISQPALSKAIKILEQEAGKKLIIPSGRGIAITDYGRALAHEALPLVEKLNALKSSAFSVKSVAPFRVASFEVFSTYFLGKTIADCFSDKDIQVMELLPGPLEQAIVEGHADVGITYLPVPHPELDILKVASIRMGIYGSKSVFDAKTFSDIPFVIPLATAVGTPSKAKGVDGWPDHEVARNIKYRVSMMETALDLCRRRQCVGYFPDFVVELHNLPLKTEYRLDRLKAPKGLKTQNQDVYLIKRKTDIEDSSFKKLARALRMLR